tara:strand:- start:2348 stop:3868 length:1521 start_codon:yes stop_codon:yes gene_type:complete
MRLNVIYCVCLMWALIGTAEAATRLDTVIGAVVFEGVTAFSANRLLPLYEDSLGEFPDAAKRDAIRLRVIAFYIDQGYLEPEVTVSLHPEAEQILRVQVTEPFIDTLHVTGGSEEQRKAVRRQAEPVIGRGPVSTADIDRFARAIESATGMGLTTTVGPGALGPAGYQLNVEVASRVEGELTYSAEGSQRLGQHLVGASVRVYGPAEAIGEMYLSALHTVDSAGYRNVDGGISLPLSTRNVLYVDISSARAVPQDETTSPSTVYRRMWSRILWNHDLLSQDGLEMSFNGALILRDYTRERGDITEIDEALRIGELGVRTYLRGNGRTSRIALNGRAGLEIMGAARTGVDADDGIDLEFQYLEAEYTLWQNLPADFSLRWDLAGQYSEDNLPYSQRFSIGGSQFAKAYEPGEFSGDSGAGTKLELRRGFNTTRYFGSVRWVPYLYYGVAAAWENETDDSASAAASGVGLRMLTNRAVAYLEFGKPLTVDSEYRDDNPRLTGRLTLQF